MIKKIIKLFFYITILSSIFFGCDLNVDIKPENLEIDVGWITNDTILSGESDEFIINVTSNNFAQIKELSVFVNDSLASYHNFPIIESGVGYSSVEEILWRWNNSELLNGNYSIKIVATNNDQLTATYNTSLIIIGTLVNYSNNQNNIIKDDTYWSKTKSPYIIENSITFEYNGKLTIEKGTTLKFGEAKDIQIGFNGNSSSLIAVGTEEEPIIFTSLNSNENGYWSGIRFYQWTHESSILNHCKILYGGGSNFGNIYCNNVSNSYDGIPVITNCEIAYSAGKGILSENSVPYLENNYIHDNTGGNK